MFLRRSIAIVRSLSRARRVETLHLPLFRHVSSTPAATKRPGKYGAIRDAVFAPSLAPPVKWPDADALQEFDSLPAGDARLQWLLAECETAIAIRARVPSPHYFSSLRVVAFLHPPSEPKYARFRRSRLAHAHRAPGFPLVFQHTFGSVQVMRETLAIMVKEGRVRSEDVIVACGVLSTLRMNADRPVQDRQLLTELREVVAALPENDVHRRHAHLILTACDDVDDGDLQYVDADRVMQELARQLADAGGVTRPLLTDVESECLLAIARRALRMHHFPAFDTHFLIPYRISIFEDVRILDAFLHGYWKPMIAKGERVGDEHAWMRRQIEALRTTLALPCFGGFYEVASLDGLIVDELVLQQFCSTWDTRRRPLSPSGLPIDNPSSSLAPLPPALIIDGNAIEIACRPTKMKTPRAMSMESACTRMRQFVDEQRFATALLFCDQELRNRAYAELRPHVRVHVCHSSFHFSTCVLRAAMILGENAFVLTTRRYVEQIARVSNDVRSVFERWMYSRFALFDVTTGEITMPVARKYAEPIFDGDNLCHLPVRLSADRDNARVQWICVKKSV